MKISRRTFEKMVWDALAEIPLRFRRQLKNVAFILAEKPTPEQKRLLGLRANDDLLGLYEGLPVTGRGADYGNVLPDQIVIFREPIVRRCPDRFVLREEIRKTVRHEIGHYFGLDDRALRRLEKYPGTPGRRKT